MAGLAGFLPAVLRFDSSCIHTQPHPTYCLGLRHLSSLKFYMSIEVKVISIQLSFAVPPQLCIAAEGINSCQRNEAARL